MINKLFGCLDCQPLHVVTASHGIIVLRKGGKQDKLSNMGIISN